DSLDDDFNSFGNNDNGSSDCSFNDISENNKCINFEFLSEEELKGPDLVWKNDNGLEKTKRGPYKIGKTPKSTYYDKYGPNDLFTKATDSQSSESIEIDASSDSKSEIINQYTY
ncbi:8828_t:CDS:2, partial [Funneliformis geosporum]